MDKNYKKEDVVQKKDVRITTSYSRSRVSVDDVRNKALGVDMHEEIIKQPQETTFEIDDTEDDNLLVDLTDEKGIDTIRQHARDFIAKREAPAVIPNDGKQTPMKGHPVFIAQHATATCCRECIRKWHKMQPGRELSQVQQDYLVDVIMTWIQQEIADSNQQPKPDK